MCLVLMFYITNEPSIDNKTAQKQEGGNVTERINDDAIRIHVELII